MVDDVGDFSIVQCRSEGRHDRRIGNAIHAFAVFSIQRGSIWWYTFRFRGQRIQESTGSASKTLAIRAERQRRRELEEGVNRLKADKRPTLFSVHARQYLESNAPHWSKANLRIESYNVKNLSENFGRMLPSDIAPAHISKYQAKRKAAGAGNRTVNMEVGTLRAILRKQRLWANLQPEPEFVSRRGVYSFDYSSEAIICFAAVCR